MSKQNNAISPPETMNSTPTLSVTLRETDKPNPTAKRRIDEAGLRGQGRHKPSLDDNSYAPEFEQRR